ncbi:MAG: hypothetical protein RR346_01025 [Bacteroidales bacterium]
MNSHYHSFQWSRDFVGIPILKVCSILFVFCLLVGCEKDKSLITRSDNILGLLYQDISEKTDEYSYTNSKGEFLVNYEVEFFPLRKEEMDEQMEQGELRVSSLIRQANQWFVSDADIQIIPYPQDNTLPLFVITDNLQQEDFEEGFRLDFYNVDRQLIRSVEFSVEEWLVLISEVRQSHYGYLEVDLLPDPHDLLSGR